jgi:hypothetical protein
VAIVGVRGNIFDGGVPRMTPVQAQLAERAAPE